MTNVALTPEIIRTLSYNELIGLVRETNRPPGGRLSVVEVARAGFVGHTTRVLDIGCSTGFTALEIARLTGCTVVGIDINPMSIIVAQERAAKLGLLNVRFELADATALPFDDGSFDLVFCGNVTSIISDDTKALSEYRRVLKPNGLIAAIPMYYIDPPPQDLVKSVRQAIQVPIAVKYKAEAIESFEALGLEMVCQSDWRFEKRNPKQVIEFCDNLLAQAHVRALPSDVLHALRETYVRYMELFRVNLSHMGYSVLLLRKSPRVDEGELFGGEPFVS